jgi:transposase-like protein
MKCPTCKAWADVLETRSKPNNEKYRRYKCANNHNFSTKEAVAVWEQYRKSGKPDEVRNLLRSVPNGLSVTQIAKVVGITVGYVRKVLVKMDDVYITEWAGVIPMPLWSVAERGQDKPPNARRPRKSEETLRKLRYNRCD